MSAHFESAISRLRPTSERRARTTAVATLAAAQNGTYACARGLHVCTASGVPMQTRFGYPGEDVSLDEPSRSR